MNTAEKLARARGLAQGVITGKAVAGTREGDLLDAIERVRKLPMHGDVAFVLDLVVRFIKGSR